MREDLEQIKQRIPLLEYLQRRNWIGCRIGGREEFVGLCPLHADTRPSFYVNARKNLFYCFRGRKDASAFAASVFDSIGLTSPTRISRNKNSVRWIAAPGSSE